MDSWGDKRNRILGYPMLLIVGVAKANRFLGFLKQ